MHLAELKLWNFRKFGTGKSIIDTDGTLRRPDLQIPFNKGVNLIVGENDCGKSALLDSIKMVCKTNSTDWIRIEDEDFYLSSERLRIECIIRGIEDQEAKNLIEWLGFETVKGTKQPFLRLNLDVVRIKGRIFPADVKGGPDDIGVPLDASAKELLQVTYLKALRDAKQELAARKNSRLSRVLSSHKAFKNKNPHHLTGVANSIRTQINEYFQDNGGALEDNDGRELKAKLDSFLKSFLPITNNVGSAFSVTEQDIKNILENLKLVLSDVYCGLGSDNILFIAVELLLLQRDPWDGLRLGLVEELEAHLHPQAQMRVVEFLQKEANENKYQLLLTTHSPNLASKVELENLIVCTSNGQAFPMGPGNTHLDENRDDYRFLRRFLDVTKANLFFAKGVLLVEGYAEAILLPIIAEKLSLRLTDYGISVVNVGSTAFLRFARIFLRKDGNSMPIRVSVITDFDFRPKEYSRAVNVTKRRKDIVVDAFTPIEIISKLKARRVKGSNVRTFFSPAWTLEYCLCLSEMLRQEFYSAVLYAWKEKKRALGIRSMRSIDAKIDSAATEFDNWRQPKETIAFSIYHGIILKQQLSKAAIAQYFSESIQAGRVEISASDCAIRYIVNAIKFSVGHD